MLPNNTDGSWEALLRKQLGKPYGYGSKWKTGDANPTGPVDCSGFTKWAYSLWNGKYLPPGSQAQYDMGTLGLATYGALGFFATGRDPKKVHHVGILLNDDVIEARGKPYNEVILRPRVKWEAWKEFMGWYSYK